jgi:2-polyprenyl-6-methoxyphenol hydroxylase-like FAD-dependent oxidoreductase
LPRFAGQLGSDPGVRVDCIEEAEAVGGGALYAVVPGKGFLAHREAGNVIHTYVVLTRPVEWFADIDFTDAAAARARIAAEFDGWAPELTALITDGETGPILRSIYQLPDRHQWDRVPGVTLIGDAAHVTVPGGEGANIAMLDGAELGQAIAAHETIELIFGASAPNGIVNFFNGSTNLDLPT